MNDINNDPTAPIATWSAYSVMIDYTNHRGERGVREIVPYSIVYGANEYHPDQQWLLLGWDVAKRAERTFTVKDIHRWGVSLLPADPTPPTVRQALEEAFMAMGRQGANADTAHPLRHAWELAREALTPDGAM